MGMESYYITLKVEKSQSIDAIKQLFKKKYAVSRYKMPSGKLFRRHIIDNSRFVIDNKAVVSVIANQETIEITFELCFCNYENNLLYMYSVANWVATLGKVTCLKVHNSEYNFQNIDYNAFKTILSDSFCLKYHHFLKRYGKIDKDILPCNFYSFTRNIRVHPKT